MALEPVEPHSVAPEELAVRVLLVDDTPETRRLVRLYLERRCVAEVVAEGCDGVEGVSKAHEFQPEVVVLDLTMPVMDGETALPLLLRATPGVAVIVHSTLAGDPQVVRRLLAAGAKAAIEKGDLGGLVAAIEAVRASRRAPSQHAG